MKPVSIKLMCLTLLLNFGIAGAAFAQDPLAAAPEMYKLLFENDQVRVMQVTFKPGQKVAKHSHPDHFVVVDEPGKLKIFKPDGTSTEMQLTKDQVVWIPAETHWAENTGTTEVKLTVNELKPGGGHAKLSSAQ